MFANIWVCIEISDRDGCFCLNGWDRIAGVPVRHASQQKQPEGWFVNNGWRRIRHVPFLKHRGACSVHLNCEVYFISFTSSNCFVLFYIPTNLPSKQWLVFILSWYIFIWHPPCLEHQSDCITVTECVQIKYSKTCVNSMHPYVLRWCSCV